jgi:hypothetical protein
VQVSGPTMAPLEMSRRIFWREKRPVLWADCPRGYLIRVEVLGAVAAPFQPPA